MNEPKKKVESKRKLTLHRETLKSLEVTEPNLLEEVVGAISTNCPSLGTRCYVCDTANYCTA